MSCLTRKYHYLEDSNPLVMKTVQATKSSKRNPSNRLLGRPLAHLLRTVTGQLKNVTRQCMMNLFAALAAAFTQIKLVGTDIEIRATTDR